MIDRQGGQRFTAGAGAAADSGGSSDEFEDLSLLLVEDDKLIRESLLDWLESVFLDLRVIGAPFHGVTALAAEEVPNVVVVDIALSEGGGVEAIRTLVGLFPDAPIVALVLGGEEQPCAATLTAGASACLLIWKMHEELVPTVRQLVEA